MTADDLGWSDALTDLSSSEDASDAPAHHTREARASKRAARPAYSIQAPLRPHRPVQYTAESLYSNVSRSWLPAYASLMKVDRDAIGWAGRREPGLPAGYVPHMSSVPVGFH